LPEQAAESTARVESRQVVERSSLPRGGGELARLLSLLAPDVVMCADLIGQQNGHESCVRRGGRGGRPLQRRPGGSTGRDRRRARAAWIAAGTIKVAFVFHVASAWYERSS